MRYHFVMDGYSAERLRQIQEMSSFREQYLTGMEEGETYLYSPNPDYAGRVGECLGRETVLLRAQEYSPEGVLVALASEVRQEELYIFGSGFSGSELAVRLAARTGGSSVTGVCAAEETQGLVTVKKMVYSNYMEGSFAMKKGPYCISLAKGMKRGTIPMEAAPVSREIACRDESGFVCSREFTEEESVKGLENAGLVIAAGRGAKSKGNVEVLEQIATELGGELGVSRPAAMNAWAAMNRLIGVSGAMLSPQICITAGVSGAAAFYAGIERSEWIVAVNTDEKAPIMKKADIAIVDDFMPVLEALRGLVEQNRTEGPEDR